MEYLTHRALYAALIAGSLLGLNGCAPAPHDARLPAAEDHPVTYRILGSGQPVLVMISGLGDGMKSFEGVAAELAQSATVIVYDRAGYGGSKPAGEVRDAAAAERELSALLSQSKVLGPYTLLGHSLGGLFAEYYAAKHPDDVAGLILEESRPADFTRQCESAEIALCTPPTWLTWLMQAGTWGEASALAATEAQTEAAGALQGKSVLVLSRPNSSDPKAPFASLWTQAQEQLAARYPGSRHLTAIAGGHYIHRDQRNWFVAAVRDFLAQSSAKPVMTADYRPRN